MTRQPLFVLNKTKKQLISFYFFRFFGIFLFSLQKYNDKRQFYEYSRTYAAI